MMKSELLFHAGFDRTILMQGHRFPISINFESVPHLLIVAPSGSGKTYLLRLLLGQLAQKPLRLILADYKGIDFPFLNDCPFYYRHSAVEQALNLTYQEMQNRMASPSGKDHPMVLCFDEWSGFLASLAKKEQEAAKEKMSSMLMLGRGVKVFVIMALQRADASYITGRDNFGNAIGLGRLSTESARMLFPDDIDEIQACPRGQGYLRTDGRPLQTLVVPRIRNLIKNQNEIKHGLC